MTTPELEFLSLDAAQAHTATVILIHGLSGSGHGWKPIVNVLKGDPELQHIKWIMPHAPTMSVTVHQGKVMPAWYDTMKFGPGGADDEPGMLRSRARIEQFVEAEVAAGIPAERILIGGFSQGGTMSALTGLTIAPKLAGVVVLSGRLPLQSKFKEIASEHCRSLPIFWGQGTEDQTVQLVQATQSVECLTNTLGITAADPDAPENGGLSFHQYEGLGHSISPEELEDLKRWLKRVLPTEA
ncbi:hypothetical protein CERSUDRAFT_115660 [Gelatoporia subvermispora B]|uniref:Acyl-protein thioesterase 1 n=1 Tax=Ceriporiopsis subvermispora (strain B) TaxID=914234 RepID=M2RDU4_CERS8|nr:hypothetical protein CERSUDRAFT_115660 [Gelatoporia subvermispora B]